MDLSESVSLSAMDQRSHFHAVSSIGDLMRNGPTIFTEADGVWLRDEAGINHLDMGAGLWCVNVGYGRQELVDAAATAMKTLSFQHVFGGAASPQVIQFADRLLTLFREKANAPHMARVLFGTSGSDANDTAYKLVRYYHNLIGKPAKKKVISRVGAYHGLTYSSGSLTGISSYHKAFDMPIEGVLHAACPHYYRGANPGESEADYARRLVSDLRTLIEFEGPENIAAFIAEPIMGTGGVIPPPEGYFKGVQSLLQEFDILFVVDEVITGFGRTGEWFGTGLYGLKPDIVNVAKGLTSAYIPMSATILGDRVWSVLEETSAETGTFMHGFTYSGHPVACAVGMAVIDLMEREKMVDPVATLGKRLLSGLQDRVGDNPYIGDIRGVGLMAAIEFVANRESKRDFTAGVAPHRIVAAYAKREHLLTRALPYLPVNSFSPPLNITEAEIDEAVDRYARAVHAATPELEKAAAEQ